MVGLHGRIEHRTFYVSIGFSFWFRVKPVFPNYSVVIWTNRSINRRITNREIITVRKSRPGTARTWWTIDIVPNTNEIGSRVVLFMLRTQTTSVFKMSKIRFEPITSRAFVYDQSDQLRGVTCAISTTSYVLRFTGLANKKEKRATLRTKFASVRNENYRTTRSFIRRVGEWVVVDDFG